MGNHFSSPGAVARGKPSNGATDGAFSTDFKPQSTSSQLSQKTTSSELRSHQFGSLGINRIAIHELLHELPDPNHELPDPNYTIPTRMVDEALDWLITYGYAFNVADHAYGAFNPQDCFMATPGYQGCRFTGGTLLTHGVLTLLPGGVHMC